MTEEQKEIEKIRKVLVKLIAWSVREIGMANAQTLLMDLGPDPKNMWSPKSAGPIEKTEEADVP